jgi:AraC-like DNA-binding protein
MKGSVHPPTALLKPFVKNYILIDSEDGTLNRILPDTSLVMVFRYKGQVTYFENETENSLAPAGISGLRKTHRLIRYAKNSGNVIVALKEAGAAAFLKGPLHELFGHSFSLDHFISRSTLAETEERLAEAKDHPQRIAIIEQFLFSVLRDHEQDMLIAAALQKIHSSHGSMRIKDLAHTLCISPDAFEKRFRRTVGTSPKQFSSIVRLRTLIRSRSGKSTFTELAHEAGYFDQAHFTKEFKLFTGLPPSDFFSSASYW